MLARMVVWQEIVLNAGQSLRRFRGLIPFNGRPWANILGIDLFLPFQFGVVKPAGVAESPCAIRTTTPLGRVNSVAAVASPRRSRALIPMLAGCRVATSPVRSRTYASSLLYAAHLIRRFHAVAVHGHFFIFVGAFAATCFSSPVVHDHAGLHHTLQIFQHALHPFGHVQHVSNFTF